MNQRSPNPETRIPKSVPFRLMQVTRVEPSTLRAGSIEAFASSHGQVQEKLIIARQEPDRAHQSRFTNRLGRHCWKNLSSEDGRRRYVSLVHLVAHGERLRHEGTQRNRSFGAQNLPEERTEIPLQPPQAGDHASVVRSEAHDLPQSLIHRAKGAVAGFPVLHDEDQAWIP